MNKQNKARVETIMMNAHTEGNGIKTALIPVDLCELSPIYQRDQGRHVAHIASNWDDNKAGHLEASERGDHFNIWDGGNRLRAAVMVGKTHVLCNIRTGLTDEDEAHLFVTQEENVTKLTQYDKFIAACASGEERGKVALLLRDICDEYNRNADELEKIFQDAGNALKAEFEEGYSAGYADAWQEIKKVVANAAFDAEMGAAYGEVV